MTGNTINRSGKLREARSVSEENKMAKLIEFIEEGQPGGNQYAAVDVPEGEYGTDDINRRVEAQSAAFAKQYANALAE